MDPVKIGRFISQCRKKANLTQTQLADKLGLTNRAVSKWETGRALPDSAIMLELCSILGITVNDLLSGEVVTMDNYNKNLESNLLEMVKQKENADKLKNLAQLPDSCYASAACLEQQRNIFEKYHVFSPAMIDGIINKLRSYGDQTLRADIDGKQDEMLALVRRYFHCG